MLNFGVPSCLSCFLKQYLQNFKQSCNDSQLARFSFFHNYFAEAKARIEGPDNKEVHVKQRSRVKLTCVVDLGRGHGQDSAAVFWYLDGKALDWLGQTGPGRGVQVK